ncbi:MAG: nucleotide pyrophosphohydrolase [Armatimonadetes bacterium]|nr:nucleotide pyrophosphohydrolase [Armatimonadota bacterium]
MITVVGLGPSDYKQISVGARKAIRSAPTVFVRTSRHPAINGLAKDGIKFISFDNIYESAKSFDEVYSRIAKLVLEEASRSAEVVYAVPGHPLIGEESVRILLREASNKRIPIRIVGSESFIEASLEALGIVLGEGLKILDALALGKVRPDLEMGNLIYQVYDKLIASEVKLALMEVYPDDYQISIISAAGTPEQEVREIPLFELDRYEFDHLTTVYIPPMGDQSER